MNRLFIQIISKIKQYYPAQENIVKEPLYRGVPIYRTPHFHSESLNFVHLQGVR
jgi:hypothetical protein